MHGNGLTPADIAGMLRNESTPARVSAATVKRVIRETVTAYLMTLCYVCGGRITVTPDVPVVDGYPVCGGCADDYS
jgi:formylmethanofuran dehydrogenase subunit E